MMSDIEEITFLKNEEQLKREMLNWNVRDELKGMSVEDIREFQPSNDFAVALINVDGGLNIGSIIRSAVIFGADKVFLIGQRRYDRRSAVGAQNYIDVEYVICDPSTDYGSEMALNAMVRYKPVAVELGGISIDKFGHPFGTCYIFGSEREGIPPTLLNKIKDRITIPQFGVMRSLNVAVAAGIIMHEATWKIRETKSWRLKK